MLERSSLLKIAMAAVFATSLAALPLTIKAQETTEPATKSDTTKAKKKTTTTKAKTKATETPASEPKSSQAEPSTATDKKGRPLTPGQIAVRERQRKCGAEWTALPKEEQAKQKGGWPKYWSACNTRLKAEVQGKKG